jgi:putative endopeptidase
MKDEDLDDAFVYGYAAASTIGHEITHGFDDQGRQYDAKGNLTNCGQKRFCRICTKDKEHYYRVQRFNPVDTLH